MYVSAFIDKAAARFSISCHSSKVYVTFFYLTFLYFLKIVPPIFITFSGEALKFRDTLFKV